MKSIVGSQIRSIVLGQVPVAQILEASDGYTELGLVVEAWNEIDVLPPGVRERPAPVRRRQEMIAAHGLLKLLQFPSAEDFARVIPGSTRPEQSPDHLAR